MGRTAKQQPGSPWLEYTKLCGATVAALYAWALFEPVSFATTALPVLKLLGAGSILSASGLAVWIATRHPRTPTHEDWSCGHYITGAIGSGKTSLAYLLTREFCEQGWGWIWVSIKPLIRRDDDDGPRLLEYLPPAAVDRVILFAPYSTHPRGLNFLRTYIDPADPGAATERELLADQTAELFARIHPQMSEGMRELIRAGALALLTWAAATGTEVTLWELFRFFDERAFRETVLDCPDLLQPVRSAFDDRTLRSQQVAAVINLVRRAVTSTNLLVALSQTGPNAIDLWDVMANERWLVCDTPEDRLGPGVAAFLCGFITSRVQMLTSRRRSNSRPFGVFCDEFQEYTSETFARAISTAREFRLAWFLIHQSRANQPIGRVVAAAVQLCRTKYYFRQTPEDANAAAVACDQRWEPQSFVNLPSRRYRAVRSIRGESVFEEGRTPPLPPPDYETAAEICRRSQAGPTRQEILQAIQRRRVERLGGGAQDVADCAPGLCPEPAASGD